MALDDLYLGWRNFPLLRQESDECFVGFSFNGWGRHLHLDPVTIGPYDFILRRFGLEVDLYGNFFHFSLVILNLVQNLKKETLKRV